MFLERYLIFLSPAWYLLVASSVLVITSKQWVRMALSALAVLALLFTVELKAGSDRDTGKLVEELPVEVSAEYPVILCPAWTELQIAYHFDRAAFADYAHLRERLRNEGIYAVNVLEELPPFLTYTTVVYVDGWDELVDPEGQIYRALEQEFPKKVSVKEYKGFRVTHFAR